MASECAHVGCDQDGAHRRIDLKDDEAYWYCDFHDPLEDKRLRDYFADPEEVEA